MSIRLNVFGDFLLLTPVGFNLLTNRLKNM